MDNHFHLVLRNENGKMSRFMQAVHPSYGFLYRKSVGGRGEDKDRAPVEQVFWEFERRIGKRVERIDTGCHEGKRQRAELLVLLRDQAGLTYREIMEFEVFRDLSLSSLGSVYAGGKRKRKERTG